MVVVLDWNSDIPWFIMPDMDKLRKDSVTKISNSKYHICRTKLLANEQLKYICQCRSICDWSCFPGICLHNTEWPKYGERECSKVEFIRNYKIHLAFENGDSTDYVTEKIYHAFEAGVLPVYMGTRGVS